MRRLLVAVTLLACGGSGGGAEAPDASATPDATVDLGADDAALPDAAAVPDSAPVLPDAAPAPICDDSHPPVVFAHGLLAAGDTWSAHVRRFLANGECPDRLVAFDWNTLDRTIDHRANLDAVIDALRARHGVEQVDLVGHSAGGGLGYEYLAEPARAAKVRRYVHVASTPQGGPAGPNDAEPVPTLNLWSRGDTIIAGADIAGAENVALEAEDHYAAATSAASFRALYGFLRGGAEPATDDPAGDSGADGALTLSGRALTLGDNTPDDGATLELHRLDAATGAREDDVPEATAVLGPDAVFGPFEARTETHYEVYVRSTRPGARPIRYFYRPFLADEPLLYPRTFPTGGLPGALLGQIPFDEGHMVLVVYLARGAMLAGRDSLLIDGEEVCTEAIAAADDTTIALFVYDDAADGQPGGSTAAFEGFPFLAGLDRVLSADPAGSLTISFNGQTLTIPRRPAGSEGAAVVVFD